MSFRKVCGKIVWKYSHVLFGFGGRCHFYEVHVCVWIAVSTVCAAYQRNSGSCSASWISHLNEWVTCWHSDVQECLAHRITYFCWYVIKCSTKSHYYLRTLLRISAACTCVSLMAMIMTHAVPTMSSAMHRVENKPPPLSPRFNMFFLLFLPTYIYLCFFAWGLFWLGFFPILFF